MTLRRFILSLFVIFLMAICGASALYFLDAQEEYKRLRTIEAENQRRLSETELRLREQERILERLRTDPTYVEKVIRSKLGYARPDETIFRFPE
jgi:cell division protein FtsB